MEKIEEQLNNLFMTEAPAGLHEHVMRKAKYHKIKPALFIAFSLLAVGFIAMSWQINAALISAEFTDMVGDFFEVFSFNFSFINTIFSSFFEIISPLFFTSAILCLLGAIYTGKKISFYQFSQI